MVGWTDRLPRGRGVLTTYLCRRAAAAAYVQGSGCFYRNPSPVISMIPLSNRLHLIWGA